jgi:hypothetical protein
MSLAPRRIASQVQGAVTETLIMDIEAVSAVNDLVRLDPATNNRALVAADNNSREPIIGRVSEKLSLTIAKIVLSGVVSTTLTGRGKVYLGTDGKFSLVPPSVNFLQILGYSFGNGKLRFDPNSAVTKLT